MCFSPLWRAIFRHRSFKKWSGADVFCTFWLTNVLLATACNFFDIGASKSGPVPMCFAHFDWQMCFSPQRVPFFDIGASKSGPVPTCFVHFDLQMCLWPQPHTICPDRNSKNLSHNEVLSTFWLTNVLVATAACYLSCLCATATSAPAALATSGTTNHWKKHSDSRHS